MIEWFHCFGALHLEKKMYWIEFWRLYLIILSRGQTLVAACLLLACCSPAPFCSLLLLAACCSYHYINIFGFTWSGEGRREDCGAVGELGHTKGLHRQLFKAHHAACELGWCLGCHGWCELSPQDNPYPSVFFFETISGDLFKGVLIRVSVAKLIYIILILIYVLLHFITIC